MIRPVVPADTSPLVSLAEGTGVFKPLELTALREVLDDYHATNAALGHQAIALEIDERVVGFAYFAPAAMTDRSWYLYWIAVAKDVQAKGLGSRLLQEVETQVAAARGRVLWIETSSLPHYEATRRFYVKQGCQQAAILPDYYAAGDSMVVFRKVLLDESSE